MVDSLLSNPFVRAVLDDALAPFASRLPAEDLVWLEQQLAWRLEHDPEVLALLQGAHPRAIDISGERGPLGIDEPKPDEAAGNGDE
jgi:hypothetical protein